MVQSEAIQQIPAPGSRHLQCAGDTIAFELTVPTDWQGQAWLRTNLGRGRAVRREIIREIDRRETPLGESWYDIPMRSIGRGRHVLRTVLTEVGHFEAKCFFLEPGSGEPLWPPGANTALNVAPAETCCANIVYNAFVRQFGPNKARRIPIDDGAVAHLDEAGYAVIPPSGTFRDLIAELDFIIGHLGCRIVQLLPVHPTPTTYARMGRFGSPYASLSFTAVDPALAEFDPKATPLEQFIELVDAVHARGARLLLDIAINHTGWAASLHGSHPQWLARETDGQIETPGAWGVVWADLTRLDYDNHDLWPYMADVFLTWCRRGVDGFRCDAGYMIPMQTWRYLIGKVRDQFPDTLFFLEGLGGKISVTRALLNRADFNWAYSELFQNYTRGQIEHYLPGALSISQSDGTAIHFAETHDNPRLAATSATWARMRTALCALLSVQGGFAFANGVEWLATEKIDVHDAAPLNWGAVPNQVDPIRRLNALLICHPAFAHGTSIEMVQQGPGNAIAAIRQRTDGTGSLLILVNLDSAAPVAAAWPTTRSPIKGDTAIDLLSGETLTIERHADHAQLTLPPGQARCLSDNAGDLEQIRRTEKELPRTPQRVERQRLRATAMTAWQFYHGLSDLAQWDPDQAAARLRASPLDFCREVNPDGQTPRTVLWRYPVDLRREVMLPPGHFLLIVARTPFQAALQDGGRTVRIAKSFTGDDGRQHALLPPLPTPGRHKRLALELTVYDRHAGSHHAAALLLLTTAQQARVRKVFARPRRLLAGIHMLGTNGRGAMMRAHAHWGLLPSRYDALLAANLSPAVPEDRRILLTRLRGWVVYQGYSQEIGPDVLDTFGFDFNASGYWRYRLPTGQGQHLVLDMAVHMPPQTNAVQVTCHRHPAGKRRGRLADERAITLILRPDIEDRNFHDATKAYTGLETRFPAAVRARSDGFDFQPYPTHALEVSMTSANFVVEPEWHYMVHRFREAQRGQDPDSDLFSPGFFTLQLNGGGRATLNARVSAPTDAPAPTTDTGRPEVLEGMDALLRNEPVVPALTKALNQYVVKRGPHLSVIAGYPWFLDWGRDTLIAARGMIAAGRHAAVHAIVRQFAAFEQDGTIPNMIHGTDTGNRDTSDAPLWLMRVCDELGAVIGHKTLLASDCGGRPLARVLFSMAHSLIEGTPNGIAMDTATGLLFSPSHFTWMDTNHPAGTPRQGYPIEIQALWVAAQDYLGRVEAPNRRRRWQKGADLARQSIAALFFDDRRGYLSDCLHAAPGTPAGQATADDLLRPNQLFALTLGAVTDRRMAVSILTACQELLVPGAIRSLADRPVEVALPIVHNGVLLNDPKRPYIGAYAGAEDTHRKPAYHNGTAWSWVFPSFCEAWAGCFGPSELDTALAWLASSTILINDGCVGHVPEILDGDAPHQQRGCDAQAWGVSELLRVWTTLQHAKGARSGRSRQGRGDAGAAVYPQFTMKE
jgi:predicted glycogen debranching enzyme